MALASAVAGLGSAVVDVDVAGRSLETLKTVTGEALDSINAPSAVLTRIVLAVVNVYRAVFPLEAWKTVTLVSIWFVPAFTPVLTRIGVAVIDVPIALNAREPWLTLTLESIHQVVTFLGVCLMARTALAFVDVNCAVPSLITRSTVALVPFSTF